VEIQWRKLPNHPSPKFLKISMKKFTFMMLVNQWISWHANVQCLEWD
jgi:hypothetical protein